MNIYTFPSGPFETNTYLVTCSATNQVAIIDPAPGSLQNAASFIDQHQLHPVKILLTHSHWDHIADVSLFKKRYPQLPVFVHAADSGNLEKPGSDQLPCWIEIEGVQPDGHFKEGDLIPVGDLRLLVIETPGHSPGGVCFYEPKAQVLFSGDTLFKGSIGNLSFPTAQPKLMPISLDKLAKLPPKTQVYPGHGPSTTIEQESWLPESRKVFGPQFNT